MYPLFSSYPQSLHLHIMSALPLRIFSGSLILLLTFVCRAYLIFAQNIHHSIPQILKNPAKRTSGQFFRKLVQCDEQALPERKNSTHYIPAQFPRLLCHLQRQNPVTCNIVHALYKGSNIVWQFSDLSGQCAFQKIFVEYREGCKCTR